jgi:hypothetical protein
MPPTGTGSGRKTLYKHVPGWVQSLGLKGAWYRRRQLGSAARKAVAAGFTAIYLMFVCECVHLFTKYKHDFILLKNNFISSVAALFLFLTPFYEFSYILCSITIIIHSTRYVSNSLLNELTKCGVRCLFYLFFCDPGV